MQAEEKPVRIRIDVDYPYPSRVRSFIYTALGVPLGKDYLKNAKIAAGMINRSTRQLKTYWFFTPKTLPDKEMLNLLANAKHEIGLHIANEPCKEMAQLEETSGRKMRYYTIHGTSRLLARIAWKRWKSKKPEIPPDFPLESFYQFKSFGLDILGFRHSTKETVNLANRHIAAGEVMHFHPIWLFQRGRINQRGPFYDALRTILDVDNEFESVIIRKKFFFRIASDAKEYEKSVNPSGGFLETLAAKGVDLFTFIERKWCCPVTNPPKLWLTAPDNIALLEIKSYGEWLNRIGKKTRNMIRKAEKNGVETRVAEPDNKLAKGIWRTYNESPIRQERRFPHYGTPLQDVQKSVFSANNSTYIGAYFQQEFIGFIQLVHGDNLTIISQILSRQDYWDRAVNNALIAKAVEVCASKAVKWLMYGRMGNHPTLDNFKLNNGCVKYELTRFYVPLSTKGGIAARLGLHRELKDVLPQSVKYAFMPIYNWISRMNARIGTARR